MTITGTLVLALAVALAGQESGPPPSSQSPFHDPNLYTSDVAPVPGPFDDAQPGRSQRGDASELWSVRRAYVIVQDDTDPRPERRKELSAAVGKLIHARLGLAISDKVADADAIVSVTLNRTGDEKGPAQYALAGLVVRLKSTLEQVQVIFTYEGQAQTGPEAFTAFVDALATAANGQRPQRGVRP